MRIELECSCEGKTIELNLIAPKDCIALITKNGNGPRYYFNVNAEELVQAVLAIKAVYDKREVKP